MDLTQGGIMDGRYLIRPCKAACVLGLLVAGLTWVGAAGASTRECQSWGAQPRDEGSSTNQLEGVTVTSPCSVWAVGFYYNGTADQTLIEHWNGVAWRIQASPSANGSGNNSELYGVAEASSTDAWAAGSYSDGTTDQTLIERWNGKAWKIQPSPSPGGSGVGSSLDGVAVASPTDAWAVGYSSDGNKVLIEHWNGKAWRVQPSPTPGGSGHANGRFLRLGPEVDLTGVVASSSRDAWAVGFHYTRTAEKTLVEHWNGKAWRVEHSPNAGSYGSSLSDVAAASSTDAWAVGFHYTSTAGQTLVEHWNGKAWKIEPSPSPGGSDAYSYLYGVAAASPTDAWAAGLSSNTESAPLIEHWNGKAWKVQPSPNLGAASLAAIAAGSAGDAWAVGEYQPGSTEKAFAIHCC